MRKTRYNTEKCQITYQIEDLLVTIAHSATQDSIFVNRPFTIFPVQPIASINCTTLTSNRFLTPSYTDLFISVTPPAWPTFLQWWDHLPVFNKCPACVKKRRMFNTQVSLQRMKTCTRAKYFLHQTINTAHGTG